MSDVSGTPVDFSWSREKVKAVLDELSQLEDFDSFPLPNSVYREFFLPMPEKRSLELSEYLRKHAKATAMSFTLPSELRVNIDSKTREVLSAEPITLSLQDPSIASSGEDLVSS